MSTSDLQTVSLPRAAQILRDEAASLRDCHTLDGNWTGEAEAKAAHDEMLAAADSVDAALSRIEALERENQALRQHLRTLDSIERGMQGWHEDARAEAWAKARAAIAQEQTT